MSLRIFAPPFAALPSRLGRLILVLSRNGFRMPKELVLFFKNFGKR